MKPGDLVIYKNKFRIRHEMIGIILSEESWRFAHDNKFFNVLLEDGHVELFIESYLTLINEKSCQDVLICK